MAIAYTGIARCMMVDLASVELDRVHERIAGWSTRAKPRARVRKYLSGLVAGVERKNGRRRPGTGLCGPPATGCQPAKPSR